MLMFVPAGLPAQSSESLHCRLQGQLEQGADLVFGTQYENGIGILAPMLDSFPASPDLATTRLLGEYHYHIGLASFYLDEPDKAASHLAKADSIIADIDQKGSPLRARIQRELGLVAYFFEENIYKARDLYDGSLEEWHAAPQVDSFSIALTLQYAGQAAARLGEFSKAENYYQQSLDIRRALFGEMHYRVAAAKLNLGNLFFLTDQFQSAKEAYMGAKIFLEANTSSQFRQLERVYSNLAVACANLGEFEEAIDWNQKAMQLVKAYQADNREALLINLNNLAYAYLLANQTDLAKIELQKAMALIQHAEVSATSKANTHFTLAKVKLGENDLRAAIDQIQMAMMAFSEEKVQAGEWDKYPNIWEAEDPEKLLNLFVFKARLLMQLAENSGDSLSLLQSSHKGFRNAALLAQSMHMDFENSQDVISMGQREKDFEMDALECTHRLARSGNLKDWDQQALNFMEQGKYRLLLKSVLQGALLGSGEGSDSLSLRSDSLWRRALELEFLLSTLPESQGSESSLRNDLLQTRILHRQAQDELAEARPQFDAISRIQSQVELPKLKQMLANKGLGLVEFALSDSSLFCLSIGNTQTHLRKQRLPLGFADSLSIFKSLNQQAPNRSELAFRIGQLGHFLYRHLLEAEFDSLHPQITTWLIVPDGPLLDLPFEALATQLPKPETSFSRIAYLLKHKTLSMAASASLVMQQDRPKPISETEHCLGMGWGSKMERELKDRQGKFRSLPGSEEEISYLEAHLAGKYFLAEAAKESAFKQEAPKHGILHLALHAESAEPEPFILFPAGQEREEDGILYFHELYQLRLRTRLAVLSACKTGTGKMARGEGIQNIASGFSSAGVATVIMALWELDDKAGFKIISNFYNHALEGKDLNIALRASKMDYLDEAKGPFAAPFYWSSFSLSGDTSPLHLESSHKDAGFLKLILTIAGLCILAGLGIYLKIKKLKK